MRVEKTERYVTTVDELPQAWRFVMEHIDSAGADPTVHISPVWTIGNLDGYTGPIRDQPAVRHFEVMIEGMQEVEE